MGVVTLADNNAEIVCLIRSLVDTGKDYVVSMLESLGALAGATTRKAVTHWLAAGCAFTGDGAGA